MPLAREHDALDACQQQRDQYARAKTDALLSNFNDGQTDDPVNAESDKGPLDD